MTSRRVLAALVFVAMGLGGGGLYAFSSERADLRQQTATEISRELWAYQSRPDVDSLSRLAQSLDNYAAQWYAPNRERVRELSSALSEPASFS